MMTIVIRYSLFAIAVVIAALSNNASKHSKSVNDLYYPSSIGNYC
jgi:hypothetical protein